MVLLPSCLRWGLKQRCGTMCETDRQPPEAVYSTHNNPQSNTGGLIHKNRHTKGGGGGWQHLLARPLNLISPLRPPQRVGAEKSGKLDLKRPKGPLMYQEIHFTDGIEKIIVGRSLSHTTCSWITDWICGQDMRKRWCKTWWLQWWQILIKRLQI